MAAKGRCWLMKTEPAAYSIDDLAREGKTSWEGVRNYQARNYLRDDVDAGDGVLFYHSSCATPSVVGLARVCRAAYPDPSAFDPQSPYFDKRSSREHPTWFAVDVEFVARFERVISLAELKRDPKLAGMLITRPGMRLSVQPVERRHFDRIMALSRSLQTRESRIF